MRAKGFIFTQSHMESSQQKKLPAGYFTAQYSYPLDKAPRLVFILILRRVPQPLQTFCRFFEAPQFSGKCLKVAVLGGLALPHYKLTVAWVFTITSTTRRRWEGLFYHLAFTDDYEFGGSILIGLHKFDRPMGALPSPLRFLLLLDGVVIANQKRE